ncbi:aminodeoxychorismate lyase [Xylanimonas cellulosilytica DSM 15894]|uniref:Endolytic murein transglycosylase n=1 Tax=Xylanimonas cellulosilytica (strain DSM 15894 / JCM 12276 / CECT 5975 / KCTC 9989 / LMG 20990 / NBRC 107835 / XIL07) TaxID=446471 RepID=D1BSM2_XYLCX|nr:endolytic transglycosylase MltG [Xylanimonas cellulosilytica]ACZ30714.1 aminodeoxychorismate lyase [Xylanimonas cellulosilytica DSM 15894]
MTDVFEHFAPTPPGRSRRRTAAQRRRRRRRGRAVATLCVVLAFVAGVATAARDELGSLVQLPALATPFGAADYSGPGGEPVHVEIPAGATGTAMAHLLYEAGVVASARAFTTAFAQHPGAAAIQPGLYELLVGMRAADAVDHLAANERVEARVTIPEGFTAEQVLDRLDAQTHLTRAELDAAVADPESIGLPAKADGVVEGWLFPATYPVKPTQSATDVLSAMIARTTVELDRLGIPAERRQSIITEASIIEREAPAEYRGKVARVIKNRLEIDKPLGMDAIDAYGLGRPAHLITRAEFRDPNLPFASRVHRGLPPTPIGNPGVAAIQAAADPTPGDWLWFVTVDLHTGETRFTDDHDEFLQFRRQYQRWAAENGF